MTTLLPALLLVSGWLASGLDLAGLEEKFDAIVRESRAKVGVALIHVESGATLSINGDQRFPMASVYKVPIALELLAQVAEGRQTLDRPVTIAASDIRACCTLSRRHPKGGITKTAGELLELMLVESDNTSSDAVLKLVGGPGVVQQRLRSYGFNGINVNRYEGDINFEMTGVREPPPQDQWTLELQHRLISEVPMSELWEARQRYMSDPRDTATPDEMARFLGRLQVNNLLPVPQTLLMLDLMARAKTGPQRLRGRLPAETVVAHKTGTTDVVINDVGIITLPDDGAVRGHLVIAVFAMNGRVASMQGTIARLSGAAFEFFSGRPLPVKAKAPAKKHVKKHKTPTRKAPSKASRRAPL